MGFEFTYNTEYCSSDTSDGACVSVCRDYTMPNGVLTSPYYPAPYPDETECIYTISQQNGSYVYISLIDLPILDLNGECTDYLEIRDGKSGDSPLMGRFCGGNRPTSIQSTQNFMWIRYVFNLIFEPFKIHMFCTLFSCIV